jgi:hypothetical protein
MVRTKQPTFILLHVTIHSSHLGFLFGLNGPACYEEGSGETFTFF